eukprot:TRINITY_DN95702_c0_g1_i1.p1 TRINITY_DN95702_c0_g1~~TRINITY_DN95702_c0_g1_i1.p1  ORF type:complete len:348 (-),score=53.96 TRINITY_DN95702_c0_g1_i1:208-1251(-)
MSKSNMMLFSMMGFIFASTSASPDDLAVNETLARQLMLEGGLVHPRRLQQALVTCGSFGKDGAACAACKGCVWDSKFQMCNRKRACDYKDQKSCCANADAIVASCYWTGSTCVEKKCDQVAKHLGTRGVGPEAQAECAKHPGCQYTCGGCRDKGMTCTCSQGSAFAECSNPGAMALLGQLLMLMGETQKKQENCKVTKCMKCLGNNKAGSTIVTSDVKKAIAGTCKDICAGVYDCDAEINCGACPEKVATTDSCTPIAVQVMPDTSKAVEQMKSQTSAQLCGFACAERNTCHSCGSKCYDGECTAASCDATQMMPNLTASKSEVSQSTKLRQSLMSLFFLMAIHVSC